MLNQYLALTILHKRVLLKRQQT